MSKIERFEDLVIWQQARINVKTIYKAFEGIKDYGFKDQIQRAAISIMNNIAEGFERGSDQDFKRFLYISKASAGEVRSMLYIGGDLGYIDSATQKEFIKVLTLLSQGIASLIKYLSK